jgi:hypothetical protein
VNDYVLQHALGVTLEAFSQRRAVFVGVVGRKSRRIRGDLAANSRVLVTYLHTHFLLYPINTSPGSFGFLHLLEFSDRRGTGLSEVTRTWNRWRCIPSTALLQGVRPPMRARRGWSGEGDPTWIWQTWCHTFVPIRPGISERPPGLSPPAPAANHGSTNVNQQRGICID